MKKTGWIILGVIVVLVLWVFSGYNGMVGEQEKATTELSNMQAQYQRRADMMPQLAKIVKAYANSPWAAAYCFMLASVRLFTSSFTCPTEARALVTSSKVSFSCLAYAFTILAN